MKKNSKLPIPQSVRIQKKDDLVMHKLLGEHEWEAIANYSDPFLTRCRVCGITDSNSTQLYSSTSYSGGLNIRASSSWGSTLTMSGLSGTYDYIQASPVKPDLFITSPKHIDTYLEKLATPDVLLDEYEA